MSKIKFKVENRSGWKAMGEVFSLLLSVGVPILFILWFLTGSRGREGRECLDLENRQPNYLLRANRI